MYWADSTSNIEAFSQWLGRPIELSGTFLAWNGVGWATWEKDTMRLGLWSNWMKAKPGREVMLAVAPFPKDGVSNLDACAAGQYEAHHRTLANNLASYGLLSAYLRIGWEMDGQWYPWGTRYNAKETVFAACFRRVVNAFRQAQPTNRWKFMWNPTVDAWSSADKLDKLWPGDAYVDLVGVDVYDHSWAADTYPYPDPCDAACRLARQKKAWSSVQGPRLATLSSLARAHGKPMAIPEWGVWIHTHNHAGGDNPYFIQKMHDFMVDPANKVVLESYFHRRPSHGAFDTILTAPGGGDIPTPTETRFPNSAALYKKLFGPGSL